MPFYRLRDNILQKGTQIWAPGYTLIEDDYLAIPEENRPTELNDDWVWQPDDDAARVYFNLPPIEAAPVRREATRFQTRAALLQLGILDQVDAFIEQHGDALTKLAWKEGNGFSPDSPVVRQMASAFGLTDDDVENIFNIARSINM